MRQKSLLQRRNEFAISIRREHKENFFQQIRKKLLTVTEDTKPLYLVQQFQLKEDPSFTQEYVAKDDFIFVSILLAKANNLLRVTFIKNQVIDIKQLPPKNSELELQQVQLPKQYSFNLQKALYDSITKDIFSNQGKYKTLPKEMQNKFITFWINFLRRNKYMETSRQKQYHAAIINLLTLFVNQVDSPDLRNQILNWVSGTESLSLIFNCLSGNFLDYAKYSKIYAIIQTGLKHNKLQTKMEAIEVLLKSIKLADYDDIQALLFNKSSIFVELLRYFQKLSTICELKDYQNFVNSFRKAAYCLLIFLETYDQYIVQCAKEGAGYIGAILICCEDPQLISQGLSIFQHIANVADKQYVKEAHNCLLFDKSIESTGVWRKIGKGEQITKHQSLHVQRQFTSFICNFIANASFDIIILLDFKFERTNEQNLVDILIDMFLENEDPTVLENIILSLKSLIYYGNDPKEEIYTQENEKQKEKIEENALRQNVIICKIENSQMKKKLIQVAEQKGSTEGYTQKTIQLVEDLLRTLQEGGEIRNEEKR